MKYKGAMAGGDAALLHPSYPKLKWLATAFAFDLWEAFREDQSWGLTSGGHIPKGVKIYQTA